MATAAPAADLRGRATCTAKLQRKAWHTLTTDEKADYIKAELCLMERPATLGMRGTRNRFEELQWIHQIQAGIVHGVVSRPLPLFTDRI